MESHSAPLIGSRASYSDLEHPLFGNSESRPRVSSEHRCRLLLLAVTGRAAILSPLVSPSPVLPYPVILFWKSIRAGEMISEVGGTRP